MNYRIRWQQRRRRALLRRVVIATMATVLAGAIILAIRHPAEPPLAWRRAIGDGRPMYLAMQSNLLVCASQARRVHGLRATTGRSVWPAPARGALAFGVPPVLAGRYILCANDDGSIQALARHSGEILWSVQTAGPVRCLPLVADDTVYVGSGDGNLYALGLRDGVERWRFRAGAEIAGGCVLAEGAVVFGTAEGYACAVDGQTGRLRWQVQLGSGQPDWRLHVGMPVCAQPVVFDGKVIIPTDGGRVYWLSPSTGAVTAMVDVPGAGLVRAAPVADAARIYLATTDGCIAAYDRRTLQPLWHSRIGRELSAGPILTQDCLLCANGGPHVLALAKDSGRVRRRWDCQSRVEGSLVLAEGLLIAATARGDLLAFRIPAEFG